MTSPLYHIDRVVRETGAVVSNGFEEIYVNTKVRNDSDVSELMRIFVEDNAYSSRFPKTSELKRRYKADGGGDMASAIERFKQEGRAEGKIEGKIEGKMEILASLVSEGIISAADAAKMLNVSEEEFMGQYQNFLTDENKKQ